MFTLRFLGLVLLLLVFFSPFIVLGLNDNVDPDDWSITVPVAAESDDKGQTVRETLVLDSQNEREIRTGDIYFHKERYGGRYTLFLWCSVLKDKEDAYFCDMTKSNKKSSTRREHLSEQHIDRSENYRAKGYQHWYKDIDKKKLKDEVKSGYWILISDERQEREKDDR